MSQRAWITLVLIGAIWGASYLCIKVALDDLSEGVIVSARCALGAVVLVPLALRAGGFRTLNGAWKPLVLLALVQVAGPFLLISAAEREIASGLAGILVATVPMFTALLALRVDRAQSSAGWALVGLVIGFCGVTLLFVTDLGSSDGLLLGGILVVVASIGYAIGGFVLSTKLAGVPSSVIAAATMVVSAAVTLPLAIATAPDALPGLDTVSAMVVLGAGGTGVAFALFFAIISEWGPADASLVTYIAPVFAVAYGALILDEPITVAAIVGMTMIAAGSRLAATRSGPSRSSAPEPEPAR